MPNKKRTRQTTSVSTLISQVNACVQFAAISNRKDLLKVLKPIYDRTQEFAKEYVSIKSEIDPLYAAMFPTKNVVYDPFAGLEEEEDLSTEELEKLTDPSK